VDRLRALDVPAVVRATGRFLTRREVEALLARRDLILARIQATVEKFGADRTLY
jgi:hypothetical protein